MKPPRNTPQDKKEASPKTCLFTNQIMLALAKANNFATQETDYRPVILHLLKLRTASDVKQRTNI